MELQYAFAAVSVPCRGECCLALERLTGRVVRTTPVYGISVQVLVAAWSGVCRLLKIKGWGVVSSPHVGAGVELG